MKIIRKKLITRKEIQANPDILYVFGDNLDRVGWGGQASEMRGEVNSVGIATKRSISHSYPDDYFFDYQSDVIGILDAEFDFLVEFINRNKVLTEGGWDATNRYKVVVIPEDGLGTGLSKMPEHAPLALEHIEKRIRQLELL